MHGYLRHVTWQDLWRHNNFGLPNFLIFYKGIDGNMGQHVYNLCQSYIQIVSIYRKQISP